MTRARFDDEDRSRERQALSSLGAEAIAVGILICDGANLALETLRVQRTAARPPRRDDNRADRVETELSWRSSRALARGFERYFEQMVDLLEQSVGAPDPSELKAIAAEHGLEVDRESIPRLTDQYGLRWRPTPD